jgi:hypothetical protein
LSRVTAWLIDRRGGNEHNKCTWSDATLSGLFSYRVGVGLDQAFCASSMSP